MENIFHVNQDEAILLATNLLSIDKHCIVSDKRFTRVNKWLESNGYDIHLVDYSAIGKLGGLLRCSTLPLGKTISMTKQRSRRILMIRPTTFRKNEETAVNNAFQQDASDSSDALSLAQAEFDNLVEVLEKNLIDITVISSIKEADTPDALFPNNWLSFHDDGHVVLYPMFAENRRRERRERDNRSSK